MATTPGSAGTRDTKVVRQTEGLPAFASVENPTANPVTVNTLDAGLAAGIDRVQARGVIETWDINELPNRASDRTPS